jgi:acyl dehydratase
MTTVSFHTLEVGQTFIGPGRTLTESDHALFMMLVADWHPIHADETYAASTPFGTRVMHGSFGVALAFGMVANLLEFSEPVVAALGIREWVYKAPLFIGDTAHVEMEILGKRVTSSGDRGIIDRRIRLVGSKGMVLQEGSSDVMLRLATKAQPGE